MHYRLLAYSYLWNKVQCRPTI